MDIPPNEFTDTSERMVLERSFVGKLVEGLLMATLSLFGEEGDLEGDSNAGDLECGDNLEGDADPGGLGGTGGLEDTGGLADEV